MNGPRRIFSGHTSILPLVVFFRRKCRVVVARGNSAGSAAHGQLCAVIVAPTRALRPAGIGQRPGLTGHHRDLCPFNAPCGSLGGRASVLPLVVALWRKGRLIASRIGSAGGSAQGQLCAFVVGPVRCLCASGIGQRPGLAGHRHDRGPPDFPHYGFCLVGAVSPGVPLLRGKCGVIRTCVRPLGHAAHGHGLRVVAVPGRALLAAGVGQCSVLAGHSVDGVPNFCDGVQRRVRRLLRVDCSLRGCVHGPLQVFRPQPLVVGIANVCGFRAMGVSLLGHAVVVGDLASVTAVGCTLRFAQSQVGADGRIAVPAPPVGDVCFRIYVDLAAFRGDLLPVGRVRVESALMVIALHHIIHIAGELRRRNLPVVAKSRYAVRCVHRHLGGAHLAVLVQPRYTVRRVYRELVDHHFSVSAQIRLFLKQGRVGLPVSGVGTHGLIDCLSHGFRRHHSGGINFDRKVSLVGECQQPVECVHKVRHGLLARDFNADVRIRLEQGDHLIFFLVQSRPYAELVEVVPHRSLCRHLQFEPLALFCRCVGHDAHRLLFVHKSRLRQHGGLLHSPLPRRRSGDVQVLPLHPPGQQVVSVVRDYA